MEIYPTTSSLAKVDSMENELKCLMEGLGATIKVESTAAGLLFSTLDFLCEFSELFLFSAV